MHLGDALGSVRQLADGNAAVTMASAYAPFGDVLSTSGDAETVFQYTGEQVDPTGLVYLRARSYAPSIGLFLENDHLPGHALNPASYHEHLYAYADPINLTDPSGFRPVWPEDLEDFGPNDLRVEYVNAHPHYSVLWDILESVMRCGNMPLDQLLPDMRYVTVRISPYVGLRTFSYNYIRATLPITYGDRNALASLGEEAVAIRIILSEIGSRLRTSIHGVQEGAAVIFNAQWRAHHSIYQHCSSIGACLLSGTQYEGINNRRTFDPICASTYASFDNCRSFFGTNREMEAIEELESWIRTIDLAAVAYHLVVDHLIADFTGGRDRYAHRCGGDQYGEIIDACVGTGNAHTGPMAVFTCHMLLDGTEYCWPSDQAILIDFELDSLQE